jgi:hypothetical protein
MEVIVDFTRNVKMDKTSKNGLVSFPVFYITMFFNLPGLLCRLSVVFVNKDEYEDVAYPP